MWLLASLLIGCAGHNAVPRPQIVSTAPLLQAAVARPAAEPTLARFDIGLTLKDKRVSANGSLILSPPDRFRLEVRGPIGGPALLVTSDGHSVAAWVASKNQLWQGADADAALRGITGGAAGLSAVVAVLSGRLIELGTPTSAVSTIGGALYTWDGPGGSSLLAELTADDGNLARLTALNSAGAPLVSAAISHGERGPAWLIVDLPAMEVGAEIQFTSWEPYTPADALFTLTAPPGAEVKDLLAGITE